METVWGRFLSFTALGSVLQPLLEDHATEAFYVDSTGRKTLASAGGGLTVVKGNFLHDRSVKQASAAGVYFGPVYAPRLLSNPGARSMEIVVRETAARRLPEGRRVAGTGLVGETLDLSVIQDLVRQTRLGTSGYVYAIDARGVPIAHPNSAAFTNRSLALPQVTRALASSQSGSTVGRNFRGEKVLSTWATVEPVGWKVFVEQPESAAFAPVRGKIWRTALLLAAFLAVGVGLSVLLARRLVRPSKRSGRRRPAIGAGPTTSGSTSRRQDELGGARGGVQPHGGAACRSRFEASSTRSRSERKSLRQAMAELSTRRAASSRSRASTSRSSWPTCRTSCARR